VKSLFFPEASALEVFMSRFNQAYEFWSKVTYWLVALNGIKCSVTHFWYLALQLVAWTNHKLE